MTGVGVTPSSGWMIVSTPLAASTSSAVCCAGPESACVSLPMNSGPSILLIAAVIADGLRDGEDMRFGERAAQRRAAMPAGAEGDELRRIAHVGLALVVFTHQRGDVDEHIPRSGFSG